jgi:hypothetical protein
VSHQLRTRVDAHHNHGHGSDDHAHEHGSLRSRLSHSAAKMIGLGHSHDAADQIDDALESDAAVAEPC